MNLSQNSQLATGDVPPEEKALLTTGADYWSTHAIPELGVPRIRVSDGPHGLRVQDDDNPDHLGLGRSLPATCFPPAVTLASSWDPQLIRTVGEALAREARALGVDVVLGPRDRDQTQPLVRPELRVLQRGPAAHRSASRSHGARFAVSGCCGLPQAFCLQHPRDRPASDQRRRRRTGSSRDLPPSLRPHHPRGQPLGNHERLQPDQRRLRQRELLAAHPGPA